MFDLTNPHKSQDGVRPVRSKYLIAIVTIVCAAVAAVVVKIVLKSHVSEPVRQGAGMYVMWLCLYPAMKAWSHKPERASSSKKRQLNFIGWTIIGLLPAIFVTVAYIYFP